MACLAAKPVVDGLKKDVGGAAVVLRAKLRSAAGDVLGARYKIRSVPTFLAFDREGRLVLRKEGLPVPVAALKKILR